MIIKHKAFLFKYSYIANFFFYIKFVFRFDIKKKEKLRIKKLINLFIINHNNINREVE